MLLFLEPLQYDWCKFAACRTSEPTSEDESYDELKPWALPRHSCTLDFELIQLTNDTYDCKTILF